MELSERGLALIKKFENFRAKAYLCPAGVWTIGYGTTKNVRPGDKVTKAEAEALLREDLVRFQSCVTKSVHVPLDQGQYDALVSLCYNIGEGTDPKKYRKGKDPVGFRNSTLLKLLNQGRYDAAARQFDVWVRGGGTVLPGLKRRRAEEQVLFKSGDDRDDKPIAPSTVIEPLEPKSVGSSKTVAGVGAAAALGGGAVIEQASDLAEKHSSLIDALVSSQGLTVLLGIGAAIFLAYAIYRVVQDRKERI